MKTETTKARLVPIGHSLSLFLMVTFAICVAFGLALPGRFEMHEAWAPLLPGFEWLTLTGFIFGLGGAYLYGWYIAVFFVPIYNFFHRQ